MYVNVLMAISIIFSLNKYPIRLPPSYQLDFAGRLMNIYQIIAHLMVFLKFIGLGHEIYGARGQQNELEFMLMNIMDYAGWIAIFSRLDDVHWIPKTLANTHMATGMMSLLGHEIFQEIYIQNNHVLWNWFRASFVLLDSVIRSYYHFWVLKNFPFRKSRARSKYRLRNQKRNNLQKS